jgi:membrane protease YdiL (CAAX protease family)
MAPLAEETIFRGFMFGTIRQYWGRWPALIISASVFALIHGHIPALPGLFILAIFLSLVYERTGSLWAPIMLHAIFNAVTVVGTIFFPSSMS